MAMVSFQGESVRSWLYDPDARIGDRGGFGEVFHGAGPDGKTIAVKRVPLRWDSESERRRRQREVEINQVLNTIAAENVLQVLEVGCADNNLLIVMPLADRSLAAAIGGGGGGGGGGDLDRAARLEALRQVARGLVELALVPILHRDLKPANVLDVAGRWKLSDFGIARNLLESTDTYTFRGFGTMPYMAPELWDGLSATVKTDLYAFGVLAYEVMTGTRPFAGLDETTLRRQHKQESPPPLVGSVPAGIGRLILRLLAKQPGDRPQDARAVMEYLEAAIRTLEPRQEVLRAAALRAEQRRAREDAAAAEREAEREAERRRTEQAVADFQHTLEDAAHQAREALPEVEFSRVDRSWRLAWGPSRVSFEVWLATPLQAALRTGPAAMESDTEATTVRFGGASFSDLFSSIFSGGTRIPLPTGGLDDLKRDPLVLCGAVYVAPELAQDAGSRAQPDANVVCELHDRRLHWFLLRFESAQAKLGFGWPSFARERVYMLRPRMCKSPERSPDLRRQQVHTLRSQTHELTMRHSLLTPNTVVDLLIEAINQV